MLEQVLLAPEVVVKDDLLLQVVNHFVADFVGLVDSLRDCAVSSLELVNCCHLVSQVLLGEDILVLLRVLHQ